MATSVYSGDTDGTLVEQSNTSGIIDMNDPILLESIFSQPHSIGTSPAPSNLRMTIDTDFNQSTTPITSQLSHSVPTVHRRNVGHGYYESDNGESTGSSLPSPATQFNGHIPNIARNAYLQRMVCHPTVLGMS